jgi:hypothetical protein
LYLAVIRQADDHEVVQPDLLFEYYDEELDGECAEHTNWRATFKVNYRKDHGAPRRSERQAEQALESAAHRFALAATKATQLGGVE